MTTHLFSVRDDEKPEPVYIEYPEEVLELRVTELAKYVSKMEREFFSSFTVQELEAELQLADEDPTDFDDKYLDVPPLI